MFGIHDFAIFLVTGIILNITPGPATFYILGRSIAQGRGAGIASVLGISSGAFVHTLIAALGLSALLAASAFAFLAVKLLGAAYLVYFGVRMLFVRPSAASIPSGFSSSGFFAVYRQGLLTNILNPKVALFFLAFVPQFIAPDSARKFLAFILLGLCFVTTGTIWDWCLAGFSVQFSERLRRSNTVTEILNRLAGGLFILLGIFCAAAK